MSKVETGILSLVPKGYVLAEDGEKFGGSVRIFAITNIHGETVSKWATAVSNQDGKETFIRWFGKNYPNIVPPFRRNIFVFRKSKALPA